MKITFRLILLAVAGAAAFWLWTVLFPSPEKIVLKKIASLATTASFGAGTGNLQLVGKANAAAGFFDLEAQIIFNTGSIGTRTLSGRDEIRTAALAGFAGLASLEVKFLDATAKVGADQQSAEVSCTAKVNAGGSKDFGVQEMRFQFRKTGSDWLITRAETVKTLQ